MIMHDLQLKILKLLEKKEFDGLTLREIGKKIGEEKYPQKVKHHLLQLEKKGLIYIDKINKKIIKADRGLNRNVNSNLISLPIVGSASCGFATVFADENIEGYLKISKNIIGNKDIKRLFVIRAVGDSMNMANVNGNNIEEGDYVVVDLSINEPENNDYVLSTIDQFANIKKFFRDDKNKRIILYSESSKDYPPICIHYDDYDDYYVSGKIIQVIKKPKIDPGFEGIAKNL